MAIDLTEPLLMLRVSGLSASNTDEELATALRTGRYTDADIQEVIAHMRSTPNDTTAATPPVPEAPAPVADPITTPLPPPDAVTTVTPDFTEPAWHTLVGRILLPAMLVLLVFQGYAALTALWRLVFGSWYAGDTASQAAVSLMIGLPCLVACTAFLFIAWLLARVITPTRVRTFWTASVLAHYMVIASLVPVALLSIPMLVPGILSMLDPYAPGLGFLIGFAMIFYQGILVLVAVLALILAPLTLARKRYPQKGMKARAILACVVLAVGLCTLIYGSGILRYPAKLFHMSALCHAVGGINKTLCMLETSAPSGLRLDPQ